LKAQKYEEKLGLRLPNCEVSGLLPTATLPQGLDLGCFRESFRDYSCGWFSFLSFPLP